MDTNDFFPRIRYDAESIDFPQLECLQTEGGGPEEGSLEEYNQVLASVNDVYPSFLDHFASSSRYNKHHVRIAYSFTYAWKSRKQRYTCDYFEAIAGILTNIRNGGDINKADLALLAEQGGGSYPAASKILHFCNPERFSILDIHVLRYVYSWKQKKELLDIDDDFLNKELNNPQVFFDYWDLCRKLVQHPDMPELNNLIHKELGYKAPSMRVIEIVMYYTSKMMHVQANQRLSQAFAQLV